MKKILSVLVIAAMLGAAGVPAAKPSAPKAAASKTASPAPAKTDAPEPATGKAAEGTANPAPAPAAAAETKCPEMETEVAPPHQNWPHLGLFGKYDKAAVQRGFQVYREVCSSCHSLKFVSYRDLSELGYNPEQVKAVAASVTVTDGPNDEGQMFERPGRPSDRFKPPFPNDRAARAANNGALPPDMSLLVKAREHGEDYIYALVAQGYAAPPACAQMNSGMNYNKFFPPHQIAMPKPLSDHQVSYTDGTDATLDTEVRDVVQFLAWAAEPHLEHRKEMGLKVLLFMLVFAGIMGAAKCRVWEDVK